MMDPIGESGELTLRYPVFTVLSADPGGEECLVVVEINGHDCLLLFRTRELAELYLEQVPAASADPPLALRECRGDAELEHLLKQLPPSVAHAVWDPTVNSQALRLTAVSDLLVAVQSGPGKAP